jgi:creatinine amidohydrolase
MREWKLAEVRYNVVRSRQYEVAVLPIGATEPHGLHMPYGTDNFEVESLADLACEQAHAMGAKVILLPTIPYGVDTNQLAFPLAINVNPSTQSALITDIVRSLEQHGIPKMILLNGHGGNDVPGKQTVFEARQRHRSRSDLLLLFATYWSLGGQPWDSNPSLAQRQMGHACEWETSMILRLAPQLVGPLDQLPEVPFGNAFEPATRGWITKDRTAPGHIGNPRVATAEKGETLFHVFTDDIVALLERVLRWNGKDWNG